MPANTLATPLADDFTSAVDAILDALHHLIPLKLWMVTRVEGDDWIVLHTRGNAPRIRPGAVFNWQHSYCIRMNAGDGPNIAADAQAVPAYASAAINDQASIGCYVGFPLYDAEGELFGTLCGLHPQPMDADITRHQPIIQAMATTLTHVLRLDQHAEALDRLRLQTALATHSDPPTGTLNRRGWEMALEAEETRCRLGGQPAGVIVVTLATQTPSGQRNAPAEDAGLVHAVLALQAQVGPGEFVGRLGGARFGILVSGRAATTLTEYSENLERALTGQGIPAQVSHAMREAASGTLEQAQIRAERHLRQPAVTSAD